MCAFDTVEQTKKIGAYSGKFQKRIPDQIQTENFWSASHHHKQLKAPSSKPTKTIIIMQHESRRILFFLLKRKRHCQIIKRAFFYLSNKVANDTTIINAHTRTISVKDPSNPNLWKSDQI